MMPAPPPQPVHELVCGHTSADMCTRCSVCAPCMDEAMANLLGCEHEPPKVCKLCQQCTACAAENPPR